MGEKQNDIKVINLRKDYRRFTLDENSLSADPFHQFDLWFNQAKEVVEGEPNAMALATVGADGAPSLRMVLLKHYGVEGFYFFTNYLSRKGREIASNHKAAILFYWAELERQVRIEGEITPVSSQISDEYFATRPLGARIGAIASDQSEILESREKLQDAVIKLSAKTEASEIKRPLNWGGYSLSPQHFEFWQGREDRLHDRFTYSRRASGDWRINRLYP
jgi:pyridoxamine 5'-phosphate oxidase